MQLSQWQLVGTREGWENYCASIGIALLRVGASLEMLTTSGVSQGAPTLAREAFELASRMAFCIDHKGSALSASMRKELKQLRSIQTTQRLHGIHTGDVSETIQDREQLLRAMTDSTALCEPETGDNLDAGDRERYQMLCLGAHNRPGPLLIKYNYHIDNDALNLTQREPQERLDEYLRLCAHALFSACRRFLGSDFFPIEHRVEYLKELERLFAPLRMPPPQTGSA